MAIKKTPKKKVAATKKKSVVIPKTVVPTPATEKAIKKAHKKMTKFVADPNNNEEQVGIYFTEISMFIKGYKEESKKS